jgi:23S rRNA (cytosine1962-C5)-methyltransferase
MSDSRDSELSNRPVQDLIPARVVVSRRGVDRIRGGHPWVYRTDIVSVAAEAGDLVRVATEQDRPLGWAFFSDASQITLRMVSTAAGAIGDERAFLRSRIDAAIDYRRSLGLDQGSCRVISGEADGIPGLVVDRYADAAGGDAYLVLQALTQAIDRRIDDVTSLLVERLSPRGVLARNDPKVRRLEGLDQSVRVLHGEVPDRITAREGDLRFVVDLRTAQKTGLFLDQRENHEAARRYAGGRALDAFCYHGGFALAMAQSADAVLALDSSSAAVAAARENASLNGLDTRIEVREGNVFDELRELEIAGDRFETIVLDPPAFAKNRASVERALAGYKEINLRALKLLRPGGILLTCSCSYNVSEAQFLDVLHAAAADARVTATLVEKRTQARDHPILVGVPETYYLKCVVLKRR